MGMHVLIVDADSDAALTTCAVVQRRLPGAAVVCEATPEQAWNVAQRMPPQLLLIDPAPYQASGNLLIQLCREWWPQIQVLVLTSAPVSSTRRQQLHADAYLEKPSTPLRVLAAIGDLLATHDYPPASAPLIEST